MHHFTKLLVGALLYAFSFAGSGLAQDEQALTKKEKLALVDAGALITTNKHIRENYVLCPLQRGRSATRIGDPRYGQDDDFCRQSIGECVTACLHEDAGACRDLAGLYEDFEDVDEVAAGDVSRRLHAQACALGDANACTNRAAGIVNAPRDDDPVEPLSDAQRAQCTIVMYEDACAQGEYWGCTQVARERSEEGPASIRDLQKAQDASRKACMIDAQDNGTNPDIC